MHLFSISNTQSSNVFIFDLGLSRGNTIYTQDVSYPYTDEEEA